MKWTIAGLILVGLIAAASAAVLAVTLNTDLTGNKDADTQEIEIIVASRAMPAMSMIDSSSIAKQSIRRADAPERAVTNSAQIIGRVLLVPVLEGQAFTNTQFASADSGLQLASAIPEGSRAMSITLSADSGITDLLYPGSIVDVVASFRLPAISGGTSAEVVSVTLLQGLQVLAVGGKSIMSDSEKPEVEAATSTRRQRMVTLMVNTAQAEALQLASTHGELSVSLRNPLDLALIDVSGTRISELSKDLADRIRRLAEQEVGAPPMVVPDLAQAGTDGSTGAGAGTGTMAGGTSTVSGSTTGGSPTMVSSTRRPPPMWPVQIIRGRAAEVQYYEIKEDVPK